MSRPTIAITMGDPAGIGPEVIMKALALPGTQAICHALVIGDANRLAQAADLITQSLRSDRRVRQATYRVEADVVIRAVVSDRPFVYGVSP